MGSSPALHKERDQFETGLALFFDMKSLTTKKRGEEQNNVQLHPMVSCIMPTYNRRSFVPHAIRYFLRQDYENKELLVLDDGADSVEDLIPPAPNIRYYRLPQKITLGAKLNLACEYAQGSIIANWDDDDWYAPMRLSYQVEALQEQAIEVCGINQLLYFDLKSKKGYLYRYPSNQRIWLLGSSLCFTKALWERNKFAEIQVGMDGLFVWATPPGRVRALENYHFSVHLIHPNNVSPKNTENGWWNPHPVEDLQQIMGADWEYYTNGEVPCRTKSFIPLTQDKPLKPLKNIFACLVHESEDCIIDLVRNLHYHDPSSTILLYNGSDNPGLLPAHFPFDRFGVIVHPSPTPQKHGYLHGFALDCMAFALENGPFDLFTIVDSDQLAIRSGYSQFLTAFFSATPNVGLLSNKPERINRENRSNQIALQAYKEYELWKPLLDSFPNGQEAFVHWTFWPSTVFSQNAVRDLIRLVRENELVKKILEKTKIWASEEVVFPTLIKLLGYEIAANPCNYDYVQYKKAFTMHDAENALRKNDAFWMHPVERKYENLLRKLIRERCAHYSPKKDLTPSNQSANNGQMLLTYSLINRVRSIEGWLSDREADLLLATAMKACLQSPAPQRMVEIGSFHGKSTVLLGAVAKNLFPAAMVFAIDPHEGVVGAADQGLKTLPPSLNAFKANIEREGLNEVVQLVKDCSYNVVWQDPISLLFIDGLHDYPNVSRDFRHFSPFVRVNGYVAFHDYANYYPGVVAFVDELLSAGDYRKVELMDSLIVLQKM